jgi:hypothetical protein
MQVERSVPLNFDRSFLELALNYGLTREVDFTLSGERVSNTWVIYLQDWDNSWKRLLIPNVIVILKKPLKLRLKMSLRRISLLVG